MEILEYKEGDKNKILELFNISFNKEMSSEYWDWRFKQNPFFQQPLIYLMWDKNKLIGHYAVSPVEMIIDGEKKLTALSMTTMTHPEYAGKGIFSKLASSLYKDLANKYKFDMVWGFPNLNSHYGFIKNLGWNDITLIPMLSLHLKNHKLNNLDIIYDVKKNFDKYHSDLLISKTDNKVKINKTKEYLNWRYSSNPDFDYKIIEINQYNFAAYKIIKSFENVEKYEIDILEFYCKEDINNLLLLINAIILEEQKAIIKVNLWNSIFSKEQIFLEKMRFQQSSPITYLSCLPFNENKNIISDYRNWEIDFGYSDVF